MFGLGALQTLLAFIFVFGMLVFFHELGHFSAAKASGIRVIEFSLGIGPKLVSKTIADTLYSIRWIPLGGFVKLAGMDDTDNESEDEPNDFRNRPLLLRLMTVGAGPFMNFVLAVLLFSSVFASIGVPIVKVADVFKGSPAKIAGLQKGDQIVNVNGQSVESVDSVIEKIGTSSGKALNIRIKRNGEYRSLLIRPTYDEKAKAGRIGVSLGQSSQKASFGAVIKRGIVYTGNVTKSIISGLSDMITGRTKAEVTGPIGIFGMVGTTAKLGFLNLIFLLAILSINLGVVNLLPIPILDGGWILFLVLEGIMGKPLKPEQRGFAQFIGMAMLLFLFVFASYADLNRLDVFGRIKDTVQGWFL